MLEWRRILSDPKRRITLICIPLVCLFLFFYQKCSGDFGALVTESAQYRQLLESYGQSTPAQIVEDLSGRWDISANEQQLLAQAEHLRDYGSYLSQVQEQAYKLQMSSLFNRDGESFAYRNILKTAQDFSHCTAEDVRLGNDRAVQDWLNFPLADWLYLGAVLLLVMSFLEERQKGLCAIVRACPAGRGKLQASRILILLLFSAGMTLALYYLPLAASLCLDGGWGDLTRPVQSVAAFQKCTAQLSIAEFLLQFFFVKSACGLVLGLLIWLLLSFVEQVQLCWIITATVLAVEYLLYTFIPQQSVFSPLGQINVFSYVFSLELYTDYVNINVFSFPVERRMLLLWLLAALTVILSTVILCVITKRHPFGNKDLLGKWIHLWNRVGDVLRRHLGLYGFEWYKLLFLGAGGLFLILGILWTSNISCNSGTYNSVDNMVYRQYVTAVQGPVTQSTYDYLLQARQAAENAEMDTAEFIAALDRLEQQISGLKEGAWIVDETVFLNIFGSKGWRTQRSNSLIAVTFLVACLSPLFSCEQTGDIKKILRTTPRGQGRLFWIKYAVAVGVVAIVWLTVYGRQWIEAARLLGETILSAPCSSVEMVRIYPFTIGQFLGLLYISRAVGLMAVAQLCILAGVRTGGFDRSFVVNSVALVLPAAVYAFGVDMLQIVTPLSFLSDQDPLLVGAGGLIQWLCWTVLSLIALIAAKKYWCVIK